MTINIMIRYFTKDDSWICFRHAVLMATKGIAIHQEVTDFDEDRYMGRTWCNHCSEERVPAEAD